MSNEQERAAFDAWAGNYPMRPAGWTEACWNAWQARAALAATPAPAPLTDDAVIDLIPSLGIRVLVDALWFARAIERAHGIGGDK